MQPQETSDSTVVFQHDTIAKAGAAAATVGGTAGGFLGWMIAPDLAQDASNAVRDVLKEKGDELAEKILKETGLDKIPGGTLLVKNQITDIAHNAGESTYNNVKSDISTRSAALGGAAAGAGTVLAMEGINGLNYLYQHYLTPFLQARREEKALKEEYRQIQAAPNTDTQHDILEGDDDFVLISYKKP